MNPTKDCMVSFHIKEGICVYVCMYYLCISFIMSHIIKNYLILCQAPVPVDFNLAEYDNLNETIKTRYEYFEERTWKKERANFCLKIVGTSGWYSLLLHNSLAT